MNTLDKQDDKGIFALFKGPSGSGKTVGALSFPNVHVDDLDKKMPAIAKKHFPNKSIDYSQYEDVFDYTDQLSSWISNCPFETIVGDSITSLSSLVLKTIGLAKGEGIAVMLKNMQRAMGKFKQELVSIDYYNAETRILEHILGLAKTLYAQPGNPKNVIFIAHILTVDSAPDIKTKIVTRTRSIVTAGKKIAAYIPTQFDEVYLFGTCQGDIDSNNNVGPVKHMMTSETTGDDDAKTAFNIARETDFTGKNLYDLLQGQIAGKEMFL